MVRLSPSGPVVVVVVVVVVRSHRVQFMDELPSVWRVVRHCGLAAASAERRASVGPVEQADRASPVARTTYNLNMAIPLATVDRQSA